MSTPKKSINEKAESKTQQRLMGMVYAYKKGELKDPPAKVKEIAKGMSMEDAKKYAETKHKGLPNKVQENIRLMSFKDYVDYTTPQNLNEEWEPVNYQYTWIDGDGNKTFVRVSQKEEGGKVNVTAYGPDNMGRSLANLMFLRPELGKLDAQRELKGSVQELFFGDELKRPTEDQVLKTLRRVTRLDNIRKA